MSFVGSTPCVNEREAANGAIVSVRTGNNTEESGARAVIASTTSLRNDGDALYGLNLNSYPLVQFSNSVFTCRAEIATEM